jgi:tetratricopeptide (TPR) repeat protein
MRSARIPSAAPPSGEADWFSKSLDPTRLVKSAVCMLLTALVFVLAGCGATLTEQKKYLGLSADEFNARDAGWRALESREDYRGAAKLLEEYLAVNSKALSEDELVLTWFHAAQMRAFAGDSKHAIECLDHAAFAVEPPTWPVPWNDYVAATKAFLQRDRDTLVMVRSRIAKDPRWKGAAPNLNFVDSLIENFEKPYREAYDLTRPDPNILNLPRS